MQTGPRPGALSALLQEIAAAPREEQGGAWEATLRPGATVGRFELVRELGRGGFGVVWEARDRELGRSVALKAVRAGGKAAPREERLLREAEAAARLQHPNIVTLFDVGRAEPGPYLVLELLRGETLAERLRAGPVPPAEAVRVAVEIARGVAHAHAEGVIHRDLKPDNVFLCQHGQVKVLDFGLAHMFGRKRQDGGTSGYMAPEQVAGAPEDERTDVWAMGALLFEMLVGRRPFDRARSSGEAPALEVPGAPALGELAARMLAERPVDRPRDGGEVLAALSAVRWDLDAAPATGPVRTRRRAGFRLVWLVGLGLVAGAAIAAGTAWWRSTGAPAAPADGPSMPSIAVLAFADMSPGKDQEFLSDGIAEEVLNSLARVEGLRVVGRTSSWYFKGRNATLAEIGRELRVGSVLEGSVRRDGSRLRIAAKLLAVPDGKTLWAESFDRDLGDVFALQEGIANAVVGALRVKFLPGEQSVAGPPRTTPEAHLQYLLGYQLWVRGLESDIPKSIEAYERAVAIDPGYAPAWAGLAWSLDSLAAHQEKLDRLLAMKRRALAAAERSVESGPGEARAYYARGGLRSYYRHEWRDGLADLERAIALRPNDGAIHRVHGWILGALGRLPEAIAAVRRATDLEPLSTRGWAILGSLHMSSGDFERARAAYRKALEIAPDQPYAQASLAQVLLLEGKAAEALTSVRASAALQADKLYLEALAGYSLGREADSQRALERLVALHSAGMAYEIGAAHAWRGEPDEAFAWLERAAAQLDAGIMELKRDPVLRRLHPDPRWAALLRKVDLPIDGQ